MKVVYLGFGSNMGDRAGSIRKSIDALNGPELKLVRASSLYETEPMGFRSQGWFLNAAAQFETELLPLRLLRRVQGVERKMGRVRTTENGPRKIDIDILLYGSAVIRSRELEVPHPRFRERRFVLEPLAELGPEIRDPLSGRTVAELLAAIADQIVTRIRGVELFSEE